MAFAPKESRNAFMLCFARITPRCFATLLNLHSDVLLMPTGQLWEADFMPLPSDCWSADENINA